MRTSQIGIDLIKHFEGFSSVPYQCLGGKPTIGYGHVIRNGERLKSVTESEAEALLRKDLYSAEQAVLDLVEIDLHQHQFDALVSLVFNIGRGAFLRSTVRRYLNRGKIIKALEAWRWWNKVNGELVEGLVRRRELETRLFFDPVGYLLFMLSYRGVK